MFKHPLIDAIFELILVNDKHQFVELHQNIEHAKAAMHFFDPPIIESFQHLSLRPTTHKFQTGNRNMD